MDPDKYQQAWRSESSHTRVTVDADSLWKAVQRNQQELRAAISWSDFGAIGIELLLLPVWIYLGLTTASPWTWYLMLPVIIWSAGFKLVARARRKQTPSEPGAPLLSGVKESLALMEQQIWLQRNIFWWSQLPMAIAMLAYFAHISWQSAVEMNDWLAGLGSAMFLFVFVLLIFSFIYYFNQRAVRTQYEPQRHELLALLADLSDETTSEVRGEYPILMSANRCKCSPRRMFVGLCLLIGILIGILYLAYQLGQVVDDGHPKKSGTLTGVPTTRANRQAIRDEAQARERREQQPGMRPAVPIDDPELFRTRIDEFLRAARTKAGFSGAVIVARGGQPIYEGAFGFSHLDSRAPNSLDTPFRIASLSKQFTAAAIFHLESQGKLSIDDPVHQHVAEFAKQPYRDITIHHLLAHTSGLPRIPESINGRLRWDAMSQAATPVDDYVRLAVQMPLEFAPGADYQYSNFGYRVLSALIARVSGREYPDFMEEEIFRRLGMKETGVARITRPPSEARIAEGLMQWKLPSSQFRFANGEKGRNYGTGYGSGGIYTSANDLLRWDRALAGDEFLTQSQKETLFQPIHGYYACGWIVKKSGLDGRLYQMHNGANEGFFSQMMRIPEDDLVVIAAGNVTTTREIDEVLDQLFRLCRSLPYHDP
jgi:CubicO group peptidase (beta-lactamase class C family)